MNRLRLAGALLIVVGVGADRAAAQAPGPPLRPGAPGPAGYSPYLNLARPGSSPAVNYYGLVRPQQYFQNSVQSLQATAGGAGLSPILGGQADGSDLPGTGLPVQFMNHRAFFMNLGAGGAGFGTAAGAGGSAGRGMTQGSGARPAPMAPRSR